MNIDVGEVKAGIVKNIEVPIDKYIDKKVKVISSCNCAKSTYDNKSGILHIRLKPNNIPLHLKGKVDSVELTQSISIFYDNGKEYESLYVIIKGTIIN